MKINKLCVQLYTTVMLTVVVSSNSAYGADPIKIGIIGDQTGAPVLDDLTQPYQVLEKGVQILNGQSLQGVIHTGDLVESTLSEAKIRQDFAAGSTILNSLTVPWYLSAGDHDVNPPDFTPDSQDRSRETLFKSLYSVINPKVATNLYYSFDIDTHHFIALYAEENLHTDPRWGNVYLNQISDAQYQWLQSDLEANKTNPGIVVFIHQPMWYNWTNWAKIHNLLKQYPVTTVVAGHFHYNQTEVAPIDGITYMVVGATGGKTKTGTPNAGDIQHVTVMTLNGKNVSFEPLPITQPSMTFTPRPIMDLVQASDLVLGNLYNFSTLNPVFLKGSQLVNDCSSSSAAQVRLQNVGNPTNNTQVMSLQLLSESPSIEITSGTFVSTYCIADIGPYNCQLKANQAIGVSNDSLVEMDYNWNNVDFWNGTLGIVGSAPITPQDLKMQVSLSYRDPATGDNYMVYQQGTTSLTACP